MINKKLDKLPNLIIFDWDNTIIDNWDVMYKALNYSLEYFGKESWDMEKVKSTTIYSRKDYFPKIFGNENAEKASELYLKKYSEVRTDNLSYIKNAENFLNFLFEKRKNNLLKLAVLSNKFGNFLREELNMLNISQNFDAIIGSGDYEEDKPSIKAVIGIKKLLNIGENDVVWFVGDAVTDIECAVKSKSVAILFGEKSPMDKCFSLYKPDYYFENYQDFYNQIKNL